MKLSSHPTIPAFRFVFLLIVTVAISGCRDGLEEPKLEMRNWDKLADYSKSQLIYHVVSLKTEENRRSAITQQFETINLVSNSTNKVNKSEKQEQISFSFIDAILGRDLDKTRLVNEGYHEANTLKDGELGLFRTTTEIILPISARASDDVITVVFEDDVVLASDLEFSIRKALRLTPSDWDILYLGCNQNSTLGANNSLNSPFFPSQIASDEGAGQKICPASYSTRIFGTPWVQLDANCTPGTWAYALNNRSAKKLLNLLRGMMPIREPIDEAYRFLVQKGELNVYCLNPELVRPNFALPSSIR